MGLVVVVGEFTFREVTIFGKTWHSEAFWRMFGHRHSRLFESYFVVSEKSKTTLRAFVPDIDLRTLACRSTGHASECLGLYMIFLQRSSSETNSGRSVGRFVKLVI